VAQPQGTTAEGSVKAKGSLVDAFGRVPAWVYALLVVAAVGSNCWSSALAMGKGTVGYALDDAYIHLAIAKNFALHGVWGVNPFQHVSASSSPGWILLLSLLIKIVGNHDWLPLAINIVAAIGLSYALDRVFKPYVPGLWWRALLVTGALMALPVTLYIALGMEHTLQALLIVVYFAFLRKVGAPGYKLATRERLWLMVVAICLVLIRVEDFVLIPIPFLYCLIKKDWRTAAALAVGPMIAFSIFLLIVSSQGFGIEPTSMMVKRVHLEGPAGSGIGWMLHMLGVNLNMFHEITFLFYALLATLAVLLFRSKGKGASIMLVSTALFGFLAHAANGGFGWFLRYEGYLIMFAFLCLTAVCSEAWQSRLINIPIVQQTKNLLWAAAAFGACSLVPRTLEGLRVAPVLMMNVGWQQVQMGRFIAQFYSGQSVLLNDIGAASYLSDFHLTDLIGLGTPEIARVKVEGKMDAAFLQSEIEKNHVGVGIVYPNILPKGSIAELVPGKQYQIIPVATWTLPQGSLLAPTVMIFATSMPEAWQLKAKLKQFQPQLPPGVKVAYMHL
jgi:hypothetical protein